MRKTLVFAIVLSGLSAFGAKLEVDIAPSSPFVLPVALTSCRDSYLGIYPPVASIPAGSLEFTRFNYQWTGEKTSFHFSALFLKFQAPELVGGKYECAIAGDELDLILPGGQRFLPGNDLRQYSGRCSIKCGGIAFIPSITSATVHGTLKVVGIESDQMGTETPLITEVPVSMTYEKF